VARGNPHWRTIEAAAPGDALAIFSGPDAYVSPALYVEKQLTGKVVPTWNYVTVNVHGTLSVHHEPDWLRAHVRRLVERHESGRAEPWSIGDAPADYLDSQLRAIVGLELTITRIDAKRKLSQNRSEADVEAVISAFMDGSAREQAVATEMRRDADDR
jgi:transcriptional regulator